MKKKHINTSFVNKTFAVLLENIARKNLRLHEKFSFFSKTEEKPTQT